MRQLVASVCLVAAVVTVKVHGSQVDSIKLERKRGNRAAELYTVDADGRNEEVDVPKDDFSLNALWNEGLDFDGDRFLSDFSLSMSFPYGGAPPPPPSGDSPSGDSPSGDRPPSRDPPSPSSSEDRPPHLPYSSPSEDRPPHLPYSSPSEDRPPSKDPPPPSSSEDRPPSRDPPPPPPPDRPSTPPPPPPPPEPSEPSEPTAPTPTEPTAPQPTAAPGACLEGTTREDYLLELLTPITPQDELQDITTPQGMAFAFILEDDDLDVCTYPTIQQRYGLATFYYSTDGDNWDENDLWVEEGENECEWFNVTCAGEDDLFVELIQLESNNLQGPLPNEISAIYTMEALILFDNRIVGTIPTGIGNLTELKLLDIEACNMTETLFTEDLLRLTRLEALRASFNQFNSSIPAGISSLSNLRQLWIAENQISGVMPGELAQLSSLETLFLYENSLRGGIIEGFGSMSNLTQLRLYANSFDGGIPDDLYSATNLQVLRFDQNFMSGGISPDIGNLVALEDLRLNDQFMPGFSGGIPPEMSQCSLLRNLLLNNNDFSGGFPDIFGSNAVLDFFDISNNNFEGGIEPNIFLVGESLRNVYFSNNSFTGPIPATFASAPNLRDLYFDGNQLTGAIPDIPEGTLTELTELLFERNMLEGSMPANICALRTEADPVNLVALQADCAGDPPSVECMFPDCCTRCFSDGVQVLPEP